MLLGNYSVLNKSPGRFFGGSTTSAEVQVPSNWQKSGAARNSLYVSETTAALVLYAIPSGNYAGKTWMLPQKSGEMSSRNDTVIGFTAAGGGLGGVTATGTSTMTFTVPALVGGLITSGNGSASFAFSGGGQLLASLSAAGSTSFSVTANAPLLGATANAIGITAMVFSGTLTPYAIGSMSGTTENTAVLTSDTIASAVWSASAGAFNAAGTTGAKLNAAGSGGVDLSALAAAVWAHTVRGLTLTANADVRYVNGVAITGTGVEGDTWGPA